MIAIVFLLVLAATLVGLSLTGAVTVASHLIGEILLLVGLFAVFFGMGIYVAPRPLACSV